VKLFFKDQISATRAKWAFFGAALGVGVFLILISLLLYCKMRHLRKIVSQYDFSDSSELSHSLLYDREKVYPSSGGVDQEVRDHATPPFEESASA
jgi:hypothetical protein